jgi:DNA-binding SARP family transcriptional activator/RecA/RadA recombinase
MAQLSFSCLGPFQVMLDGQPITSFKSNKVRALLAYLAVEANRPHHREVLAGLLWPDWPDRDALSNLRYTLSDLRRAVGDRARAQGRDGDPPFLLVARDTLQFNSASEHWLDVSEFRRLTAEARLPSAGLESQIESLESAIGLYRGSFLEGFSLGDSPAFEEWTLLAREGLAREMSDALHQLAAIWERRGEYGPAQTVARRQLELEPWDETAHQQLMRALALSGQRSAALAQYEVCRRLLVEELGVEPGVDTTALYEQIREGKVSRPAPTSVSLPDLGAKLPAFLEGEPPRIERPVFVSRERELAQLSVFLDRALNGQGRVVFVTGEAGSGKTALIQEFSRRAQAAHGALVAVNGNCNAYTGIGDPYLPFREILALLTGDVEARWAAGAMTREHARRLWNVLPVTAQALVDTGLDLIDTFVPRPALHARALAYTARSGLPDWLARLDEYTEHRPISVSSAVGPQQSDLFNQYTGVLQALAQRVPLLLVLDDLQWADLGSISLLFHLGRRLTGSRILIVGAYRPEEIALGRDGARHPLDPVVNEFQRDFGDIAINLARAGSRDFMEALLDSEPNRLGAAFREMLYRRTRGHPLFTIELLRGLQERGDLIPDADDRWVEGQALDWETLPARVEAAIRERISRLPRSLRLALQVASVEGEVFTAEVVARVRAVDEREMSRRLSGELDRRHRLVRADAIEHSGPRRVSRYRFRNYLFQKYLYDNLDEVERAYLHEDIGNVLEELYGDQEPESAAIAVQLAWHFQEAGIVEKAIHYLHRAGERAIQLSAYEEAITHLTRGLNLLLTLPGSPERDQQELALQLALGVAQIGHGRFGREGRAAYARALELGQQAGRTAQLCQALGEMAIFHYVRSEHHRALARAEEALRQAQQAEDPLLVAWSRWHLGFVYFGLGDFLSARHHLEQVTSFYSAKEHHRLFVQLPGADAGLSALAYLACTLWCLGYPEQALKCGQQALILAQELEHHFSLADVLCYGACVLDTMYHDAQALQNHAQALSRLAESAQTWLPPAVWHAGIAAAMVGQFDQGIAQMREAIAVHRAGGKELYLPTVYGFVAEAQGKMGHPGDGLSTIEDALALVEKTDERNWEPELHRLRAELLLMQGDEAEAEISLHRAIDVARRQQAKSWELRATTNLARLWRAQGKNDVARQRLAEVYDWFTEGFDTPDLQEARELFEELA